MGVKFGLIIFIGIGYISRDKKTFHKVIVNLKNKCVSIVNIVDHV